jgi:hypothetical protein
MPLVCNFVQKNGFWGLHHGQVTRNEEWKLHED